MEKNEIEEREKQRKTEIEWFNNCCYLNEKLFTFLERELKDYKHTKQYILCYYQHVKKSELGSVNICLKGIKRFNTSIGFHSMMYKTDKPYTLSLWKYDGKHIFKDYELEVIREEDFNTYLGYIKEFFEISKPSAHYEQLSLF